MFVVVYVVVFVMLNGEMKLLNWALNWRKHIAELSIKDEIEHDNGL